MLPNPETLSGKEVTEAYLAQLNEEQAAGHLLKLPPDRFHREVNENWINRRYLDQRTEEIFRVKGRINVHDQYLTSHCILRARQKKEATGNRGHERKTCLALRGRSGKRKRPTASCRKRPGVIT